MSNSSIMFFFQQLLPTDNNICWVLYGDEFINHIGKWAEKCNNKIIDYDTSIQTIKDSDIIIYQNIDVTKSLFSNTNTLLELTKNTCKLITIPSIYLIYRDFDNSIKELIKRENENDVDIKVSEIFDKFKHTILMLNSRHPKTFLFLEVVKVLCTLLDYDFFTEERYNDFLKNENYMQLS